MASLPCKEFNNMNEKFIELQEPRTFGEWRKAEPYVGEDGIYVPMHDYVYEGTVTEYRRLMSKELFVEAFKEYILKEGLLDVQSKEKK